MLKVAAGMAPPVLIWQVPTFYKRVREPLVLSLRVLTMVGCTGCLLLTCSTAPDVQARCSFLQQRSVSSAAHCLPANVPGWEPICCYCLPAGF